MLRNRQTVALKKILPAVAITLVIGSTHAIADTLTWDASGINAAAPTDGAGTWDAALPQWSNGVGIASWADGYTAVFGTANGAAGTVTLGAAVTANDLAFNAAGSGTYVVGASTNVLTLTSGNVRVSPTVSATITSPIAGTNGLIVSGGGSLALGGTVNPYAYTGTTVVDNSTLTFQNIGVNYTIGGAGAAVQFKGANATLNNGLNASRTLFVDADLTVDAGTTANINLGNRAYLGNGAGRSLSGGGTLNLKASTVIDRNYFYLSANSFTGTVNVNAGGSGRVVFYTNGGSFNGVPLGTLNVNAPILNVTPSGGVVYAVGALAGDATGVIDAPSTNGLGNVNTNGSATWSVGSLGKTTTFAGTIKGSNAITVTGGTLTLSGANTYTGATTVEGGTLRLALAAQEPVFGGATVTAPAGVNLRGGKLVLDYVAGSGLASSINTILTDGAARSTRFATGTLRSTAIPDGRTLGWIDNAAASTITVGYTLFGDFDVNFKVDFDDLLTLARNYNGHDRRWSDGDSNYDGNVNFDDLLALARNYNGSITAAQSAELSAQQAGGIEADFALAQSLVPEPTLLAGLMAAAPFLRRTRRGN